MIQIKSRINKHSLLIFITSLLILHEKQLHQILNLYVNYFNRTRPNQGIRQQIPELQARSVQADYSGSLKNSLCYL
jgi:hypothetical protein